MPVLELNYKLRMKEAKKNGTEDRREKKTENDTEMKKNKRSVIM